MDPIQLKLDGAAKLLGVTRDHLTAIGAISLRWASAEFDFQYVAWCVAGWPQNIGELVTADMGNISMTQLLRNIARRNFSDTDFIAEIDDLCAFFNAIRTERNNIVHSLPPEGAQGSGLTKRDALKPTGKVRSKDIISDEHHCMQLFDDMQALRRCAVPLAMSAKSALEHGLPPKTLSGREATSPHIEHLRNRLASLRRSQSLTAP